MTSPHPPTSAQLSATRAWSRRVRRVGGFIQVAFAAFWLARGGLAIGDAIGIALLTACSVTVVAIIGHGIRATAGTAPRPTGPDAKRIERAVTVATIVQLAASFAVPAIVAAAGHTTWTLPAVAVTIGPLLLWLDHRVDIPRYRPVGWALIIGPAQPKVVPSSWRATLGRLVHTVGPASTRSAERTTYFVTVQAKVKFFDNNRRFGFTSSRRRRGSVCARLQVWSSVTCGRVALRVVQELTVGGRLGQCALQG